MLLVNKIHSLKEPYGKCGEAVDLEYFETYSLSSCFVECKQKYLLEKCGCKEFYMPQAMFNEGLLHFSGGQGIFR